MADEPAPGGDDDQLEPDEPRLRPWRMIVASVIGLAGTAMAILGWWQLRSPKREPQGPPAAIGQTVASVIAWVLVVVGALVAVVAAVTLVLVLLEAREAGARDRNESG